MRAVLVMFDSLNRQSLPPYGASDVVAPNFERLAGKTVTFDRCYAGSMPCIPARRELHSGRYNFLHRSWGPLEPFDNSMPQLLRENGVHTHLVTDHQHYWEDGGATFHNRYSTYEFVRGQEGDWWKGDVRATSAEESATSWRRAKVAQDRVNREYQDTDEDLPQTVTFNLGLEFIEKNSREDHWM